MAPRTRDDGPGTLLIAGGVAAVGLFFALGAWAGTMTVASATIAPGHVVAEGHRKAVQHRDGGPVKSVLVRDGDKVKAGQPLIELDLSDTKAEFFVLRATDIQLTVRQARLKAELDGGEFAPPADIAEAAVSDPQVADIIAQERALHEARKVAFVGSVALYEQQMTGGEEQITAYKARVAATERQMALLESETDSLRPLAASGIIARNRLLEMERSAAGLQADMEAMGAEIAGVNSRVNEARIQIGQLEKTRRETVSREISETESQMSMVRPRLAAAGDRLARAVISAPEAGYVYKLAVFSSGAAVIPGQTVLEIVPADEPLVLSVEIDPKDIERVHPGQEAIIHLLPYNQRNQLLIKGTLERISPDMIQATEGTRTYYTGTVKVDEADLERSGATMLPGMPVQVLIQAGERTIIGYLLDPIFHIYDFALKED